MFDPHTGDEIAEDEFAKRYGGLVHAEVARLAPRAPVRQATKPGLTRYGLTCPGCGVAVVEQTVNGTGAPCPRCVQEPRFQTPMFNLAKQPVPAYARAREPEVG